MARQTEIFSGLFKLDVLIQLDITTYSFYEVGQKKFFAFTSNKELFFIYINPQLERFEKSYDWDFLDNPIYCMCFEPSGTWLIIVSDQKVLLVPFLPLFIPQSSFDHRWSLSSVTVLPLGIISKPSSMVCWLTKESENILIISSKTGTLTFYSLESQSIVGECNVSGEITDLQICFDDSLDLLTLLISVSKSQHYKLVLEHRSFGYNWLQQTRAQNDKDKKDSFMSYIRQLSKDKITFFIQGGSKDDKSQTVEYVLKPAEYLPVFRKGSNNWALTAQYVNGRHFLTAFEVNEGTLILESPEEDTPSRTLRPHIKKDGGPYIQGLWSQRLVYLLKKDQVEVHSASFSVIQGETLLGGKKDNNSKLWRAELIGDVRRAHLMTAKDPPAVAGGWREPTFMCDLQLPRFSLESCLIVTNKGAYILNTVSDACEWLVGVIMRGGAGVYQCCDALEAKLSSLLPAAADMLLSRGKLQPAQYLYSVSSGPSDGWVARLGVFGKLGELLSYNQPGPVAALGPSAMVIKIIATLLNMGTGNNGKFDYDLRLTILKPVHLMELSCFAAAMGFWYLVPVFNVYCGWHKLLLSSLKPRSNMCRGAFDCLLKQRCLVPLLIEESGHEWLLDYLSRICNTCDTHLLKCLCLWLNPLQDQLRPVMRDLKQEINSVYTTRLQQLISTFVHLACVIESRQPCPEINLTLPQHSDTWKNQYTPKRTLSCGLAHWAVVDEGNAKIMMTNTPINTEIIGRVIDVACGRHHTLVLTENGIYASGDNTFGQLGVGFLWAGGVGDAASAAGALRHVTPVFTAPLSAVAAGHYHSAAIDVGGRLYMWGWGVHGQLCHGTIDDEWVPKLVTKFQGRKVLSVGCGACHSVILTKNGEVWASGAGVFGQLGSGHRNKASVPVRVNLQDPVTSIAVGYFHNLALTNKGEVWTWGASPQQVRAAVAKRTAGSPPPAPQHSSGPDPHLLPRRLNIFNVRGDIVQLAAGWHHSCILNNMGTLYTWGLNFDGQLGSGDRKQIQIPTEMKINTETQLDSAKSTDSKTPEAEIKSFNTKALVACGGDFTIYIDDDGRIYATGNTNMQPLTDKDKGGNRVIMMKTTKRVIKIPANLNSNKFLFQQIDRIDIMFPFEIEDLQRRPIDNTVNPLATMKDFKNKSWADSIILILKPWINEEMVRGNCNMAAKFAYHTGEYSECLRLLLDNLKCEPQDEKIFVTHTSLEGYGEVNNQEQSKIESSIKEDHKAKIHNILSKRIKEISISILNEDSYPTLDPSIFEGIPCCCDELSFRKKGVTSKTVTNITECDLSSKAADIIDKCMSLFPVQLDLWESCFRLSKSFYLDNNLSISGLEVVLRKYMELNATAMASAIMYSNDCTQYTEILSPKFYLNMCSQILDTWG